MSDDPPDQDAKPAWYPYWGKADRAVTEGDLWHPIAYHSLDVAAVCQVYLTEHPGLRKLFTQLTGLPEPVWTSWLLFFLVLHDLGKYARPFQELRPEILPLCTGKPMPNVRLPYTQHHSSMGYNLWQTEFENRFLDGTLGSDPLDEMRDVLKVWAACTTGHHGRPPETSGFSMRDFFPPENANAAQAFLDSAFRLIAPLPLPAGSWNDDLLDRVQRSSWLIAGIAVLCDWLGSDRHSFEYCARPMPLAQYYKHALSIAEKVVHSSGVLPLKVSQATGFHSLVDPSLKMTPSPLQQAVQSIPIAPGSNLFILEDLTGSGKTEAALLLAQRIMQSGEADGLLLALPTMATTNAMHARLAECYRRLFQKGTQPSLSLAHSAIRNGALRGNFPSAADSRSQYSEEDVDAGVYCTAWIAEGSKRSFLADVGACTVDQALLAVLPARHQSLRLLGLSRKVLILDEVHAYDAYMNALIQKLLEFHAGLGGSAILLSATLPEKVRKEFHKAFSKGAGFEEPQSVESEPTAEFPPFPMITRIAAIETVFLGVPSSARNSRKVGVRFIRTFGEALTWVELNRAQGKCVCWIRNTVQDATDAFLAMKVKTWGKDVDLFHARFALGDRLEIETRIVERFGKRSGMEDRRSKVVISTQVVEQSLDLDFDEMLIDLPPIDLVLQRAGRLRRHPRNDAGLVHEGTDQRGESVLHILSPEAVVEPSANWYSSLFPRGAHVYKNHAQLWRTARLLERKKGWNLPEDSRAMIEEAFASDSTPFGLETSEDRSEGARKADRSLGRSNTLPFADGYHYSDQFWDEEATAPTRLGESTVQIVLARWIDGELSPWRAGEEWLMGELRVRRGHIDSESSLKPKAWDAAQADLLATHPELKYRVILVLEERSEGRWVGGLPGIGGSDIAVEYTRVAGFRYLKDDEVGQD